jgi:hypothetical protein
MMDLDSLIDSVYLETQIEEGRDPDYLIANGANPKHLAPLAGRTAKKGKAPRWSQAEIRYLDEHLGVIPMEEIAANLGRSRNAIKMKMGRLGLDAPSKQPGYLTGNGVADALGVDIHAIITWHERGILRFEEVPLDDRKIWRMKYWVLLHWVYNPDNWIYFLYTLHNEIRRIPDPFIRKLVERRRKSWGDEWWTTGQVAEYHGLTNSNCIQARIMRGTLPAKKFHNWRVLKSQAIALNINPRHNRRKS